MSAIQEKIKKLQRQQEKIDLFAQVKAFTNTLEDGQTSGLAAEVKAVVVQFLDLVTFKLEKEHEFATVDKSGKVHLTSEEVSTIRRAVNNV